MTVSKNHTRQAGKRAIVVGCAFFCVGRTGANTLVITHSPSSVFHLCRVPDPQRWGSRQDWVNWSDELQYPWSPHWLLFSGPVRYASQQQEEWQARQGRAYSGLELASSYSEPWGEPAVLSSQGPFDDCSTLLSLGVPKCVFVYIYIYIGRCVVRLWSESSACQTTASVDCPGRFRVSTWAEKHTIYFRGKDVGIQRGHIYSLLVCWEDLPVKA